MELADRCLFGSLMSGRKYEKQARTTMAVKTA